MQKKHENDKRLKTLEEFCILNKWKSSEAMTKGALYILVLRTKFLYV